MDCGEWACKTVSILINGDSSVHHEPFAVLFLLFLTDESFFPFLWSDVGTANLAYLPRTIAQANVFHTIRARYTQQVPFTWNGDLLVYVHCSQLPFEQFFASQKLMEFFHFGSKGFKEESYPHIFALATRAYREMLRTSADQLLLFTGESGSGKSVNFRAALLHLAYVTSRREEAISNSEKVVAATELLRYEKPWEDWERTVLLLLLLLLRYFGNSQTAGSSDSSRYQMFAK